jgi:F-type H+-transporting ATPase subunit b
LKGLAKVTAVGALLVLAMAAVAWASAEGGEAHGLNWKDFGYRVVNFIIVVGIVWKLAGKKIGDFFRGRRVQIENQLSDLETRKVEAEKRLKTIETSIANLEVEKRQIMDEYRKQGEALRDSIVAARRGQGRRDQGPGGRDRRAGGQAGRGTAARRDGRHGRGGRPGDARREAFGEGSGQAGG